MKMIIKHKFKSRFLWYENRPLTSGCLLGNQSVKYNGAICLRVINTINMKDYWAVMERNTVKIKCHSKNVSPILWIIYNLSVVLLCICMWVISVKRSITYMSLLACQYLLNWSVMCCKLLSRAVIGINL